ncbi:DUF4942 domain-containing protein [Vibrio tubiashii]|uniref:class I SAM-dependent methyltransferase n=1 Tax=Vibrio tubiashii TaxID=29498 RepID=UPI001EFC7EBB|nr:DUF4942 domain-containing protein [Vibrio tubiashii]MCG9575478.1 DUF4942 domain-containing protein [Vibrio tubiashii]
MHTAQAELFNPTKANTLAVVQTLKASGQDFEYYPTTSSQIETITQDMHALLETHSFTSRYNESVKVLDIGAGDGRVLSALTNALETCESRTIKGEQYAIEKATIHTDTYRSKNITLLGTDFNEINFISKNADIAFCNPPYSEFSFWMSTLIMQLNFKLMYVVIPERWQTDPLIQQAIEQRGVTSVEILSESDFLDGDRQARAKVHVLRIAFNDFKVEAEKAAKVNETRNSRGWGYEPEIGRNKSCPFQLFIETELGLKQSHSQTTNKFHEFAEKERIRKAMETEGTASYELVASRGVLWALLDNYERDLAHTLSEYKKISALDAALLAELGVEYKSIREGIKEKLFGYRSVYWALLFDELEALSSRLTSTHRQNLLNTLNANALDFTYTNAIYIISYAVEMANELIEESLIDVFKSLTSEASILRHYKSNEHMYSDRWRYNDESPNKHAKYLLDYRFVSSHHSNFEYGFMSDESKGLTEDARRFCNDLLVMLKLLGYGNLTKDRAYNTLDKGDVLMMRGTTPEGKTEDLIKIRFHKNGNRHITFSQQAMLRLNVTVSRLLGWVRTKEQFEQEGDFAKPIDATIWNVSNTLKVLPSTVLALTDKRAA